MLLTFCVSLWTGMGAQRPSQDRKPAEALRDKLCDMVARPIRVLFNEQKSHTHIKDEALPEETYTIA